MSVAENVVPPLVHCHKHPALGSVIDLQRDHSLLAGLDLCTSGNGEVPVGRIEGDPSDQVATPLLHVLGGSRNGDGVGVPRVTAVGVSP